MGHLEQTCDELKTDKMNTLTTLGTEADRLVDSFNAGLHAGPTREKVESAFRDLVLWLTNVIDLSPMPPKSSPQTKRTMRSSR